MRPCSSTTIRSAFRIVESRWAMMNADRLGGGDHVVAARVGPAEGDVLVHRAGEEEALLRHDAELPAERRLGHVAQVGAVDRDPALARVVEAREELRDR